MKALTLGKNSKGEWSILHSPDVPIGEQLQAFHEANLTAMPKGIVEVLYGVMDDSTIVRTVGPKGGLLEQQAHEKRRQEKAEIQKRLDAKHIRTVTEGDPVKAAAEIDRLKGKAPVKAAAKIEPATK